MNTFDSTIPIQTMLTGYSIGVFPMASEELGNQIYWYEAVKRCIIPIDNFHISRSLKRTIRKGIFRITIDTDFERIIRCCAEPREKSPGCWLSEELILSYIKLHEHGFAHSVEVWRGGELAGGLFGVSLGGLFSGESMFHRITDASKVALWATVESLKAGNYKLFDVQIWSPHLSQFGAIEITSDEYKQRLSEVLHIHTHFTLPNHLKQSK